MEQDQQLNEGQSSLLSTTHVESYIPIKEVSTIDDLVFAIRDPQVPFTIVKMTDVTLNACPAGRFKTFCEALKFNRSLRTLTVTIDDSECQALIDALNVNRTVTRVNMTVRYLDVPVEKMLTSDTCQRLTAMLTLNHVLKRLCITLRGNCSVIFTILGKSFVQPKNTQVTLIVEDKLGKLESDKLVEALKGSNISALKLGYYFSSAGYASRSLCSTEATQVLSDYIKQFGSSLEILKIRMPLNMDQVNQFVQMIEANPRSLKSFYLETSTSAAISEMITKAVTSNTYLRKFLICYVAALPIPNYDPYEQLLRHNNTLESFAVINCHTTADLWKRLAPVLTDNTTLRELYLLKFYGKKSKFVPDPSEESKVKFDFGQYGVDCIKDNYSLTKVVLEQVIPIDTYNKIRLDLAALVSRNRKRQNELYADLIVIMYNIARTTMLPIDVWVHVFKHIRVYGINRDFGNILADLYDDPSPRKVVN